MSLTPKTKAEIHAARKPPTPAVAKLLHQLTHHHDGQPLAAIRDELHASYLASALGMIDLTLGATITIDQPTTPRLKLLAATLAWLQSISADRAPAARHDTLEKLRAHWPTYAAALESDHWQTLPTLADHPDEQLQQLAGTRPNNHDLHQVPTWETTPEGQAATRWECLSLALWHLNRACDHHPASTSPDGTLELPQANALPTEPETLEQVPLLAPPPPAKRARATEEWTR